MKNQYKLILFICLFFVSLGVVSAVDIRVSDNNAYTWIESNTNISVNTYNQTWLEFDGVNDYVNLSNKPEFNFDFNKNFTIIYRFNCSIIPSASQFFFEKEISFDSHQDNTGTINIRLGTGGGTQLFSSSRNYCDNNYHVVVFTSINRGVTNTTRLYIDGYIDDELNTSGFNASSSSADLLIGRRLTGNYFNGSIDYFKIYNYSLNSTEVMNYYQEFSIITSENIVSWDEFDYMNDTGDILINSGEAHDFDDLFKEPGNVLYNALGDNSYQLFYSGYNGTYTQNNTCIGWANSSDGITWVKQNKTFGCGSGWDNNVGNSSEDPYVVYNGSTFFMYVEDKEPYPFQNISLYTSEDLINWVDVGVVLYPEEFWEAQDVSSPTVMIEDGIFYMWYEGRNATQSGMIGLATSLDGITWTKDINNPYVTLEVGSWDSKSIVPDGVFKKNDIYYLNYHGNKEDFWGNGIIEFTNITDKTTYNKPYKNTIGNTYYYFNDDSFDFMVE